MTSAHRDILTARRLRVDVGAVAAWTAANERAKAAYDEDPASGDTSRRQAVRPMQRAAAQEVQRPGTTTGPRLRHVRVLAEQPPTHLPENHMTRQTRTDAERAQEAVDVLTRRLARYQEQAEWNRSRGRGPQAAVCCDKVRGIGEALVVLRGMAT